MKSHADYFPILFSLNIAPEHSQKIMEIWKQELQNSIATLPDQEKLSNAITQIETPEQIFQVFSYLVNTKLPEPTQSNIRKLRQHAYDTVINPPKEYRSTDTIFRSGTFLKYYITQNTQRLLEDNLLMQYQTYFYDADREVQIDRLKQL